MEHIIEIPINFQENTWLYFVISSVTADGWAPLVASVSAGMIKTKLIFCLGMTLGRDGIYIISQVKNDIIHNQTIFIQYHIPSIFAMRVFYFVFGCDYNLYIYFNWVSLIALLLQKISVAKFVTWQLPKLGLSLRTILYFFPHLWHSSLGQQIIHIVPKPGSQAM